MTVPLAFCNHWMFLYTFLHIHYQLPEILNSTEGKRAKCFNSEREDKKNEQIECHKTDVVMYLSLYLF